MSVHNKVVMLLRRDFIHPFLDPRVYKEAKSLVDNGYDVSVVCWHGQGSDVPSSEEYEGIRVHRVFQGIPYHTTPMLWRLIFYILYVFKSVRISLGLRPDIIHCHDLDTLAIGVILGLLSWKPLLFDAHEDFPGMLEGSVSKRWGRLARFYEKMLIKACDRVIAAEMPYTGVMKKHYGVSPVVVANFPDLNIFQPSVESSSVIRRYRLEGKTVISHIGMVGRERGIYETLEALAYLHNDDIIYMIIGRAVAEEWDRIKETIKRLSLEAQVILLIDGVDHKETPMYYKASDISMVLLYPVPNYVTSLPTKLFESLAVGTPVLAGNLEYLGGFVSKYEVGLCADSRDPKDIARKLEMMIADRQMRIRMGENGLKAVKKEFNWDESARRLLEVYHDVITRAR